MAQLGRDDVLRLSPPGFGAGRLPATFLGYRDCWEAELERIGPPIDLVGHDWGGGHVVNAVMQAAACKRFRSLDETFRAFTPKSGRAAVWGGTCDRDG